MNRSILVKLLATLLALALVSSVAAQSAEDLVDPPPGEWPQLSRDAAQTRYSPLDQINRDNVGDLQLAWARDLGFDQTHQGGPSVWDGVMYVSTQTGVLALDATNGQELWSYSAPNLGEVITDSATRGSPVVFDGKVFTTLRYGAAVALDAQTGEELWFTQLTREERNEGFSTNPIFANGQVVMAPAGADFGGAPGKVFSVGVEDGELLWTFDVVPLSPDDPAYETWTNPPSWEAGIGGASAWNAGAYDPVSNTVIYGTGQPTPWDRIDPRRADPDGEPTSDLYTASFVALDADSGELRWYHQVVPGDEWDMDQHTVPMFVTLDVDGEERRVALLATTSGYLLLIDAVTGEVMRAHAGAPEHTIHLGYDEDFNPIINDEAREANQAREMFRMCPGLRWAHIAPPAFSPDTGLYYRPNNTLCTPYIAQTMPDDWQPGDRAYYFETGENTEDLWRDRTGALTAFDPVTGEVAWEFAYDYGYDAGPVATGGGLVFSNFTDRILRAFDAETGDVLWRQVLTAGSRAGTITYAVDGKQYVATMVGMNSAGSSPVIPDFNPFVDQPEPVTGGAAVFVYALP
jgi:PQQ-dependent dehydrogenase (methanol/ethanol family)